MLSTEISHPSNALWYRASICPRTSQDRCCNSISKPMRLSFNILMISKLPRLIRTSSNSGTSHSRSTICVCSSLMIPCNFSISIIRPMSCSFSASYTALPLPRSLDLSLAAILGKTIAKFLDTQISRFQTGYSGFKLSNRSISTSILHTQTSPGKLSESFFVQTPLLCLQDLLPTSACESNHLPTSLYLSPDKLSEFSLVQTLHLCLQDSLPTSACRDILNAHLQESCRSFHLSKHLTCVSRTHSQPQPVEILTIISKTCRLRQSIDKSLPSNDLTANMPQKVKQNTSPRSRILKFFDALDFTSAMYQPSDHFRTLVQAQHRSLQKIRELNTNDSSFTLDGVLSTLQQGSAENGVGSSAELRYHVKKRRAQICGQIQRFIKIPTELRRQTRTSTTHTKHKRRA